MRPINRPSQVSAFSIIELMVVVAIMSLLLAILIPSLNRARETSRRTVCAANLRQIGVGLFAYANENQDIGPAVMSRMGTTAPRVLLSKVGAYANHGLLLENVMTDPRVFYCPSQEAFNFNPRPEYLKKTYVAGSYAYAVHIPAEQAPTMGRLRHLSIASDDFVARLGAETGIGADAHKVGYNVLYTDGSAAWYQDEDRSIAHRAVHWDDETDDVTYNTLYTSAGSSAPGSGDYGDELDVFRVWHSFCYNQPDPFGEPEPSDP